MKAILAVLLVLALGNSAQAAEPPNIILILADDLGWGEIGPYGVKKILTPHLNAMAADGMRFDSFYASTRCSMSRAGFLTGCYAPRVSIPGVLYPSSNIGLHPDEITLAEVCKSKGYATACIGKWHLGHRTEFLPTAQGFDSFYGLPYSNDMTIDKNHAIFAPGFEYSEGFTSTTPATPNKVPLMRGAEIVEYPVDQATLTQRYTNEAVEFIQANVDRPFFLYLSHTMPHTPIAASPEFAGTSLGGARGDVVEELDDSVGRVFEALTACGISDNTIVIFTSDNGAPQSGLSGPFTGVKGQPKEGGNRVSFLARWPGRIPAGTVCSHILRSVDVLPTVASIIEAELPPVTLDGVDCSSLLFVENAPPVVTSHLYYSGPTLAAYRQGDWKIMLPTGSATVPTLYNLATDKREAYNVALANPTTTASLWAEALARAAEIKLNARPAGKVPN